MQTQMRQLEERLIDKQANFLTQNDKLLSKQDITTFQNVLKYSQLSIPTQLHMRHVRIYKSQHIFQIYTKPSPISTQHPLPHIVLIHGFGGSALHYIRIFQALSAHYQIHALDTFGTGYSSDGTFRKNFTEKQTINYYIDAIEQWRKALNLEKFQLVGHSFGGYLAMNYAVKYRGRITRLVLLSPAGCSQASKQAIEDQQANDCCSRVYFCLAKGVFQFRFRPANALNNFFIGSACMERLLTSKLRLKGKQKQIWRAYLQSVARTNRMGQEGFYLIFNWPVQPSQTIRDLLKKHDFDHPIQIYFGDRDWAHQFFKLDDLDQKSSVKVQIVKDSGHLMSFDNPEGLLEKILGVKINNKKESQHSEVQQKNIGKKKTQIIAEK